MMTETYALTLIARAARQAPGSTTDPTLQRALRWLEQRMAEIVDHGHCTIHLGKPAAVND